MIALVATAAGTFAVDLETDEVEPADPFVPEPAPVLNLPLVVAAAACGSTVIAVVKSRPPLVVSYDSGATWNESGRGLPPGHAVAIAEGFKAQGWGIQALGFVVTAAVVVGTLWLLGGVSWAASLADVERPWLNSPVGIGS